MSDEPKGKVYPWIEDEYGPNLPCVVDQYAALSFWQSEEQIARERAEILRAQVEGWRP